MKTAEAELIEVAPVKKSIITQYESKAVDLTKDVSTLTITNQEGYNDACNRLSLIKGASKLLSEAKLTITRPMKQAAIAVEALFKSTEIRYENAERILKQKTGDYYNEQQWKQREEQARLDREAKEKEEKEKARLQKASDKAAAAGNTAKAEELKERAQEVRVEAPTVAPKVEQAAGVSMRKQWKAKIVDYTKIPTAMLFISDKQKEAHQSYFDGYARDNKDSLPVAGVEFYTVDVVASR